MTASPPPRMNCQYVQPDLVYTETDCTAAEATRILSAMMGSEMTQKLLAAQREEAEKTAATPVAFPAYILSFQWPDGHAALNLYCEEEGWSCIWDITTRRQAWNPLSRKTYTSEPVKAVLTTLCDEILRVGTAKAKEATDYLQEIR